MKESRNGSLLGSPLSCLSVSAVLKCAISELALLASLSLWLQDRAGVEVLDQVRLDRREVRLLLLLLAQLGSDSFHWLKLTGVL